MKNFLIAFFPSVLLAAAAMSYVYFGNDNSLENKSDAAVLTGKSHNVSDSAKAEKFCCAEDEKAGSYSDNSIFQLQSVWKDQNGKNVKLNKFACKKIILAMIYTSCPTACPVIVENMKKIESKIPAVERNDFQFVLVSFDPVKDTPQQLKKFAEEKSLDQKNWAILTGSENSIAELAQVIGFKYKKNQNGIFSHSNLITFINGKGEIVNQSEGLNQDPVKLAMTANKSN